RGVSGAWGGEPGKEPPSPRRDGRYGTIAAMFHDRSGAHLLPPEPHFRWRGGEITRLEGFTDAVFAFAVTLLVVSLEVPQTFEEPILAMKGFVAFAIALRSYCRSGATTTSFPGATACKPRIRWS